MARILNVKDEAVTQGVLDKDVKIVAHLVEVTFEDALGVVHTVFAHKDGPFRTPEEIVRAFEQHELHDEAEEKPPPDQPPPPTGGVFQ